MRVIRGEHVGAEIRPDRYADRWISARTRDGDPLIVAPTDVELSKEEIGWFVAPVRSHPSRAGQFWRTYQLVGRRFVYDPVPRRRAAGGHHRGRLVRSDDAESGKPGGDTTRSGGATPVTESNEVTPRIERDSAEGDMLMAVHSGSVAYLPRTATSRWMTAFHAAGFRHIGVAAGGAWTEREQAALERIHECGWVRLRDNAYWVLTPEGSRQYWVWHPVPGS